ncbi:NUDIX domain-containing protein [Alicyclobacillus fodiniaquatilis]|uniref:NUDIX domain-containing protein n=1 Tax=Alicyclobacillus fodiniaquatilis TaxID=1661150 RepID=A0ABW4JFK7_9BACL
MSFEEPTIAEETIFTGRVVQLKKLTVGLPNGKTSTREVIIHPGAVAVLAEPEENHVLLVQQYRKACERVLWEIPAGKLEANEAPDDAAKRELAEETGYAAARLQKIHTFFTSPGFANEVLHVYYAADLEQGELNLDEDEFVETTLVSREQVESMLTSGEIADAKTLVALLWWLGTKS